MISIGDDVDRDADARGRDNLGTGAMNSLNQSPAEFLSVFKIKRDQAGRGVRLIEGEDRFKVNRSSV